MNNPFVKSLIDNLTSNPNNIIIKELLIDKLKSTKLTVVFENSIVDKDILNRDILTPLMYDFNNIFPKDCDKYNFLLQVALPVGNATIESSFSVILSALSDGKTLLIFDDSHKAIIIDTTSFKYRPPSPPSLASSIASSKEDLNESLEQNMATIKRRIKDKSLVVESNIVGRRSRTNVNILYLKDIANENVISNIRTRIKSLDIDSLQSIGSLQQYIEEHPCSIVPQNYITDSVESTIGKLTEGKVIILLEGSPYSMSTPAILVEFFHNTDDYNERTLIASFARMLRFIAAFVLLTLPSVYIILTRFNPDILVDKYIQPIATSRQGIPLSPFLEIFLMEVIIEFLREGGLRLPSKVGQTLSIVSGIIIGDAALQSRIVSPSALFIVGISVVCTFLIPNYQMALSLRLLKFPILIFCNLFGIFGLIVSIFFITIYLFNITVFDIDYVNFNSNDMQDTFIRINLKDLYNRPIILKLKQKFRLNNKTLKKSGESNNE
ncbi:MAG: spore germination protein [Clostridium sp.]|uniref:spore germination protein n=1 Tax=Clostridium sp. TaxID=1506 RepID=UPI003F39E578